MPICLPNWRRWIPPWFYETAPRLLKTLTAAAVAFPQREMAVAREITKMYEECVNGTAEQLIAHFSQNPPKGEIVLMVAPPDTEAAAAAIDLNSVLKAKCRPCRSKPRLPKS